MRDKTIDETVDDFYTVSLKYRTKEKLKQLLKDARDDEQKAVGK